MATATLKDVRITPEEFERMPNNEAYELINGELVERGEMGAEAQYIGKRIASRLDRHEEQWGGFSFGDGTPFRALGTIGSDVLKPDAAYVVAGRMQDVPTGDIELPADLMVEVVSPTDDAYDVEEKARTYLRGGVRVVWIVYPNTRELHEVRPEGDRRVFRIDDTVTCEDVLPGFGMGLASVFPKPAE